MVAKKIFQKDTKVLILGFSARTMLPLIQVLLKQRVKLLVSDLHIDLTLKQLFCGKKDRILFTQDQDRSLLEKFPCSMIILTPGIPRKIDLIKDALSKGIEVIGDIELFYRFYPNLFYIGVTGTNGKSTVVSLLYFYLKQKKEHVFLAGNIGTGIFTFFEEVTEDSIIILELSSFQLESIVFFHPRIALVLNLTPDHMNRYDSFKAYAKAKAHIFQNMTSKDTLILDKNLPFSDLFLANKNPFLIRLGLDGDYSLNFKKKCLTLKPESINFIIDTYLKGNHNLTNLAFVLIVIFVLDMNVKEAIYLLKEFKGLPFRLEKVASTSLIDFYNDSKATTFESVLLALDSIKDEKAYLILSGIAKGDDIAVLRTSINKKNIKKVLVYGKMKEQVLQLKSDKVLLFNSLEEIFSFLKEEKIEEKTSILFSPGGSSFDLYKNFEERGNHFNQQVQCWING